jgi:hypothetical protein
MVGHGNLAERAMLAVIPDISDFPYSVRVLCECTSSSGSSSMASTTAASMALIDAGVPIREIVAGVSIGLIQRPDTVLCEDGASGSREGEGGDNYRFIADILGSEDYFGAMDFKIAGTRNGVTAAQMDVKVAEGIPVNIVIGALAKAAQRRNKIIHHATKATMDRTGNLPHSVSAHLPPPSPLVCTQSFSPDINLYRYTSTNFNMCWVRPSYTTYHIPQTTYHIPHTTELYLSSRSLAGYGRQVDGRVRPTGLSYGYGGLKPGAPRAMMVKFDPAKRDLLLGSGGEMKRMIQVRHRPLT